MTHKRTQPILLAITVLALLALPSVAVAADQQLVGSWECVSDGFLLTFHKDGTYMSSNPTNQESASHGVWKRAGGKTFDLTDLAFIYDDDGFIEFVEQARVRAVVDGDTLTSEVLITIFDLAGNQVDQIEPPESHCTRLHVIPLP